MIRALARFVDALREEGVPVSPAEVLDASRALGAVGLSDRARFRGALRATLAKGKRQAEAFDRLFDRFFASPRRRKGGRREAGPGAGEGGGRAAGAGGRPAPAAGEKRVPRAGSEPPRRRRPDADARDGVRRALSAASLGEARRAGRLRSVRLDRAPHDRGPATGPDDPLRVPLARPMSTEEERRLAALVPRIVEEIRLRKGRRLRRSARGRLWMRRVFRENVSSGGVPFVLPRRRRRTRRPKVVLLVDVSHSVARAAGYFLQIASAFLALGRRARVIAFVDRPVEATRAVARWLGGAASEPGGAARPTARPGGARRRRRAEGIVSSGIPFADLIESLPGLDPEAPSDYGRTLHSLLEAPLRPAGRDTILVVLGDARTNRFDPLPWALEEISRRCRAVLWLNPEPRTRWSTADSAMEDYLPHVDTVVEAKDLAGLARGVAELLRSL